MRHGFDRRNRGSQTFLRTGAKGVDKDSKGLRKKVAKKFEIVLAGLKKAADGPADSGATAVQEAS
jgi:hypothetical protein